MFLTDEEIRELTGYQQRSAQTRALNAMMITHKVRPDKSILVLRAHVETLMGMGALHKKSATPETPNFDAIP